MTARTAGRLAWSLWALAMALEVEAIGLWLANHAVLLSRYGSAEDFAPHVFLVPGYATVGAVIAEPLRCLGWLDSLIDHGQQLTGQGVQVNLISEPRAEGLHRLGRVVAAATKVPVHD